MIHQVRHCAVVEDSEMLSWTTASGNAGVSPTFQGSAISCLPDASNDSAEQKHFVRSENVRFDSIAVVAAWNDIVVAVAAVVINAIQTHAGLTQFAVAVMAWLRAQLG